MSHIAPSTSPPTKVLVVGATGSIGRQVVEKAVRQGLDVRALVRQASRADQLPSLGVDGDGYSLCGSSAGARMAAAIGSHGTASFGDADLPKPCTVVMAYTGHAALASSEPPSFVVVGELDRTAMPSTMKRRVAALRKAGTEVEFHEYPRVGHGFGLGVGTSAEGWVVDAVRFWTNHV